jgi:hypothetical protein
MTARVIVRPGSSLGRRYFQTETGEKRFRPADLVLQSISRSSCTAEPLTYPQAKREAPRKFSLASDA